MSTWLTVQEAASLSGVTESAIKKAVKQNRYEHCHVDGVGRGGKQLRIALESLPEEAQARYRGEQEQQARGRTSPPDRGAACHCIFQRIRRFCLSRV